MHAGTGWWAGSASCLLVGYQWCGSGHQQTEKAGGQTVDILLLLGPLPGTPTSRSLGGHLRWTWWTCSDGHAEQARRHAVLGQCCACASRASPRAPACMPDTICCQPASQPASGAAIPDPHAAVPISPEAWRLQRPPQELFAVGKPEPQPARC